VDELRGGPGQVGLEVGGPDVQYVRIVGRPAGNDSAIGSGLEGWIEKGVVSDILVRSDREDDAGSFVLCVSTNTDKWLLALDCSDIV